jgi:prevent-host-death family protein
MWSGEVVMKKRTIAAAKFKAECLSLLDEVARSQTELTVTKRGVPVARLVPLEKKRSVKERARITGDLMASVEAEWIAT